MRIGLTHTFCMFLVCLLSQGMQAHSIKVVVDNQTHTTFQFLHFVRGNALKDQGALRPGAQYAFWAKTLANGVHLTTRQSSSWIMVAPERARAGVRNQTCWENNYAYHIVFTRHDAPTQFHFAIRPCRHG